VTEVKLLEASECGLVGIMRSLGKVWHGVVPPRWFDKMERPFLEEKVGLVCVVLVERLVMLGLAGGSLACVVEGCSIGKVVRWEGLANGSGDWDIVYED
jgi:hypothetical protein